MRYIRPMPTSPPLLIATGNPHKVEEIAAVLGTLGIACEGLGALDRTFPEPAEDGETFVENARIKAVAYARMTGRACLADDSGLEIDALGGRPGVFSARYSGDAVPAGASALAASAS
jgi:XTP/dITP diphosphohydrolase